MFNGLRGVHSTCDAFHLKHLLKDEVNHPFIFHLLQKQPGEATYIARQDYTETGEHRVRWNTFQVLGEWSLRTISAKSKWMTHTCPLFISACVWPWQAGWCTFYQRPCSEQTREKPRLEIQFFFPPELFFTIISSLLLVSMVTWILILVPLLLPCEEGLRRMQKPAEGCWSQHGCRKGNLIRLYSEISQIFPLQQVWLNKFPYPQSLLQQCPAVCE